MKKKIVKNVEEARDHAIEWQHWAGEQNLSYGELLEWQKHFEKIGKKFHLIEEFKENGIL